MTEEFTKRVLEECDLLIAEWLKPILETYERGQVMGDPISDLIDAVLATNSLERIDRLCDKAWEYYKALIVAKEQAGAEVVVLRGTIASINIGGCDTHTNFSSSVPWCPVCLGEERDRLVKRVEQWVNWYELWFSVEKPMIRGPELNQECVWVKDEDDNGTYWDTSCGSVCPAFYTTEEFIAVHCPYCGKKVRREKL